jgi:hypothetical protein
MSVIRKGQIIKLQSEVGHMIYMLGLRSTDMAKVAVSTYKTRPILRYASDTRILGVPDFPELKKKEK